MKIEIIDQESITFRDGDKITLSDRREFSIKLLKSGGFYIFRKNGCNYQSSNPEYKDIQKIDYIRKPKNSEKPGSIGGAIWKDSQEFLSSMATETFVVDDNRCVGEHYPGCAAFFGYQQG